MRRVLTVFALKNPGGVVCGRSQKPGSGLVLTVLALKNPGRVDRVLSQKIYNGSVDLEEHLSARRTTVDCGDRRPKGYF